MNCKQWSVQSPRNLRWCRPTKMAKRPARDNGVKPTFDCRICGKSFSRKWNIENHERTQHSLGMGEKPVRKPKQSTLIGGSGTDATSRVLEMDSFLHEGVETRYTNITLKDLSSANELEETLNIILEHGLDISTTGIKYQISTQVLFLKPIENIYTNPNPAFPTIEMRILHFQNNDAIKEQVFDYMTHLDEMIDKFTREGWVFSKFVNCSVKILKYNPIQGSSYRR